MTSTANNSYLGMLPPPPGHTVNLTDPESIGWRLILASVLCPVVALIFVLLRLYTARFIVQKMFIDDGEFFQVTAALEDDVMADLIASWQV
jgi:hypothetical protein